jgi:methyl-accepting chemotaxis protein
MQPSSEGFMSAALSISPAEAPSADADSDALGHIIRIGLRASLEMSESGASLARGAAALDDETADLRKAVGAAERMAAAQTDLAAALGDIGGRAGGLGVAFTEAARRVAERTGAARDAVLALTGTASDIEAQTMAASAQVGDLRKASAGVQNIAREIQLLAVNAGVEAARHGVSGRGFAVIAEAVKKLADQTRAATDQTDRLLARLAQSIEHFQARGADNLDMVRHADHNAGAAAEAAMDLARSRDAVSAFLQEVARTTGGARGGAEVSREILAHLRAASSRAAEAVEGISAAAGRCEPLADMLADMNSAALAASGNLPISRIATLCRETARRIGGIFEDALRAGEISREQLFDHRYRTIEGSDPVQHVTDVTSFTDRVLPAVQEPLLATDRRIVFAAAADCNGYIPTHNRACSQPQSDDPVWNAANARNRRIFNDRAGLASARNQKPLLLQSYRRDMGGGAFLVMHEISAPIRVAGRHWGGFRIGFRL